MNQRQRQIDGLQRLDTVPRYRHRKVKGEWEVYVDGRRECGPLDYVCSEFAKTCLYYPYHIEGEEKIENWEDHAHDFAGVLQALLRNPELFSVRGFEEYYAKHEIDFLDKVQARLLEMKACHEER